MPSTPRVLVVGGGLAGLVTARHLAGGGGLEATVLERRETVGGRVRTLERGGYRFDRGFQVLFPAYPAVRRELDLEALDLRRFTSGATIAGPDGRSVLADSRSAPRTLPATLRNPDITLGDRLRVARLWVELHRTDPDRRFDGLETLHTAWIPFAQFDQPPGIHDRLPETRDPDGAVYLAGDYTRWSSIQGAMRSGRDAAKAVLEDLSG